MFSKCVYCFIPKNPEYVTMIAPAVLSTVYVIGLHTMQNVSNDIKKQTQYGIHYMNRPKN